MLRSILLCGAASVAMLAMNTPAFAQESSESVDWREAPVREHAFRQLRQRCYPSPQPPSKYRQSSENEEILF
jgi:hypothetical protein